MFLCAYYNSSAQRSNSERAKSCLRYLLCVARNVFVHVRVITSCDHFSLQLQPPCMFVTIYGGFGSDQCPLYLQTVEVEKDIAYRRREDNRYLRDPTEIWE